MYALLTFAQLLIAHHVEINTVNENLVLVQYHCPISLSWHSCYNLYMIHDLALNLEHQIRNNARQDTVVVGAWQEVLQCLHLVNDRSLSSDNESTSNPIKYSKIEVKQQKKRSVKCHQTTSWRRAVWSPRTSLSPGIATDRADSVLYMRSSILACSSASRMARAARSIPLWAHRCSPLNPHLSPASVNYNNIKV